jgi:hypothetical protein
LVPGDSSIFSKAEPIDLPLEFHYRSLKTHKSFGQGKKNLEKVKKNPLSLFSIPNICLLSSFNSFSPCLGQ